MLIGRILLINNIIMKIIKVTEFSENKKSNKNEAITGKVKVV